jgi:hypothetical protein
VTSRSAGRIEPRLRKTISAVAAFCDRKKVGDSGFLGFRRSTDLTKLCCCLDRMIDRGLIVPGKSRFLDLGCADGRVNVLLSYLDNLPLPPPNIFLFHGDSMDESLHETISAKTGASFEEFDLFYTYLTMQEEFAELIARKAQPGSLFMVYGLDAILPPFKGLNLLTPERAMEGILALYQKQ